MKTLSLWLFLCVSAAAADTIVVVSTKNCPPCDRLKSDVENNPRIAGDHKISIIEGEEAARNWRVTSFPTLIRVRDRREIRRIIGYSGKELSVIAED